MPGYRAAMPELPEVETTVRGLARHLDGARIERVVLNRPDMRFPFLGVHLTLTADQHVKIGPTAIPALWREHYGGLGGFRLGLSRCQDRELWQRVALRGPVVIRPEITMTYCWHGGQRKPSNVRHVRERVARVAIRGLARAERRRAVRIRRSTWWFDAAQDALSDGRYGDAIGAAVRSVAASPQTFASPLVWPLFVRRLAGRSVGV